MTANEYRSRRIACGLTQEDLAELAVVSTSTVRNVEMGRVRKPRLRDRIDSALREYESGRSAHEIAGQTGPALLYLDTEGTTHQIDDEDWSPEDLPARERALYAALVNHLRTTGGAS